MFLVSAFGSNGFTITLRCHTTVRKREVHRHSILKDNNMRKVQTQCPHVLPFPTQVIENTDKEKVHSALVKSTAEFLTHM